MTLIIEDGTGVTGAQSFIDAADFAAFVLAFYGVTLTETTALQEGALWRAYVYMSGLAWRDGAFPAFGGTIPAEVMNAQACFARAELATPNVLSPTVTLSGHKTLTEVKGIKWTVGDAPVSVEQSRPILTQGFDWLRGYLTVDPSLDAAPKFMLRAIGC